MTEQRLELVLPVEGCGLFIKGIGADGVDADRRFDDALNGVIEQRAADPRPSEGQVPAHPADQDHGDAGIAGQVPGQSRGQIVQRNTVRRKGVEARDLVSYPINAVIPAGEGGDIA